MMIHDLRENPNKDNVVDYYRRLPRADVRGIVESSNELSGVAEAEKSHALHRVFQVNGCHFPYGQMRHDHLPDVVGNRFVCFHLLLLSAVVSAIEVEPVNSPVEKR